MPLNDVFKIDDICFQDWWYMFYYIDDISAFLKMSRKFLEETLAAPGKNEGPHRGGLARNWWCWKRFKKNCLKWFHKMILDIVCKTIYESRHFEMGDCLWIISQGDCLLMISKDDFGIRHFFQGDCL